MKFNQDWEEILIEIAKIMFLIIKNCSVQAFSLNERELVMQFYL